MNKLYQLGENRLFDCRGGIPDAYGRNRLVLSIWPGHVVPVCALCAGQSWVMGSLIFSVTGMTLVKKFWWRWMSLNLNIIMMVGALYTSYYAYGVEQGTVISSCTMGAGFPNSCLLTNGARFVRAQGMRTVSTDAAGRFMVEALLITLSAPLLVLVALWGAHVQKIAAGEVQ